MFLISRNKACSLTRKSDFEKRLIIQIGKRMGQRGRRNGPSAINDIVQYSGNLFCFKPKPWAS